MAKTPNFTRSAVPTPPPGQFNFGADQPPLKAGQVYLSDRTKKQLAVVGHKEGDPVPPGLADKIAELSKEYNEELASAKLPLDPNSPPVSPKKVYNIDELPADKQEDLRKFLQQAKVQMAASQLSADKQAWVDEASGKMNPSVLEAVQRMQGAETSIQAQVAAVDSGPVMVADDANIPEEKPAEQPSTTGADAPLENCPRCYYPLSQPYNVEVTEADRVQYVAVMLSPDPKTRFRKEYPVMGGNLYLTFRSPTTEETRLLMSQLTLDAKDGKINSQAIYFMLLSDYRLALSIESARDAHGRELFRVPPVLDIPYKPPEDGSKETPLKPLLDYITKECLHQETMYQVAGQYHQDFNRLLESLNAEAKDPSFWQGIAPAA